MSKSKTCLDCQHHEIERGYDSTREDPGMPEALICKLAEDTEVWEDIFELENPATDCKFFEPIVAEVCGYCLKPIGIPRYQCEYQLNHWYSGEAIAICSIECREALDTQWMQKTLED